MDRTLVYSYLSAEQESKNFLLKHVMTTTRIQETAAQIFVSKNPAIIVLELSQFVLLSVGMELRNQLNNVMITTLTLKMVVIKIVIKKITGAVTL